MVMSVRRPGIRWQDYEMESLSKWVSWVDKRRLIPLYIKCMCSKYGIISIMYVVMMNVYPNRVVAIGWPKLV